MMKSILHILILILSTNLYGQNSSLKDSDYLYLIWDTVPYERYGYIDSKGDTIIPFDKYEICFTDTIKQFGIVLNRKEGFVGIDKYENVLFEIFSFDNGPDEPSDGLFRIIKNGKIGYANVYGQIVINAQYKCALPFFSGFAEVSYKCEEIKEGEHSRWISNDWFFIDSLGNKVTNLDIFDCPSYYDKFTKQVIYYYTDSMPDITEDFARLLLPNLKINESVEYIDTKGVISFVIETNGTTSHIKIIDSISKDIDKQIIDLVKAWNNLPIGYCKGNPVPVEIKEPYHLEYQ